MDYKIESKPSTWHVILSRGEYSDYTEHHFFFHANTKDELWNFLERYLESEWGDTTINNKEYGKLVIGKEERYYAWDCDMEMLDVIHFER